MAPNDPDAHSDNAVTGFKKTAPPLATSGTPEPMAAAAEWPMSSAADPQALHQTVDVLHGDVSRLMGELGNPKCIDAADLYAELLRRMEELEVELTNAERRRRYKAEDITRQQEDYQCELEVLRQQLREQNAAMAEELREIRAQQAEELHNKQAALEESQKLAAAISLDAAELRNEYDAERKAHETMSVEVDALRQRSDGLQGQVDDVRQEFQRFQSRASHLSGDAPAHRPAAAAKATRSQLCAGRLAAGELGAAERQFEDLSSQGSAVQVGGDSADVRPATGQQLASRKSIRD